MEKVPKTRERLREKSLTQNLKKLSDPTVSLPKLLVNFQTYTIEGFESVGQILQRRYPQFFINEK